MPKRSLTDRRRAFLREYMAGPPGVRGNGTRSAIAAGFSARTADIAAVRLLRELRPHIEARLVKHEITADRIIDEIAAIAFHDTRDFVAWTADGVTLKPSAEVEHAAPVAEVSEHVSEAGRAVKIKFHDKLAALGHLAKIKGLLRDIAPPAVHLLVDPTKLTDEELDRLEQIQARLTA